MFIFMYNSSEVIIMDNFEALSHYSIPSDVLKKMLSIYKLLGKNIEYSKLLDEKKTFLESDVIEKDTFFACRLLNIKVSDQRLRLLITKDSKPANKTEEQIVGLKKVFIRLHQNAKDLLPFNGSDILDDLNLVYGKKSVSFSKENFIIKNERPKSIRLKYENILDEYHLFKKEDRFEKIFLSVITFMEIENLKPYTKHNELASIIALYYMLLTSEVDAFLYVSFIEKYFHLQSKIKEEVLKGSINYFERYLIVSDVVRIIYQMILDSYLEIDEMVKKYYFSQRAYKSDVIEQTVLKQMPVYFTKDDVRRYHPDASDSTINRILFKLRDDGLIMPLGKGRSARWMKLIKEDDPILVFGKNYARED